MLHLESEREPRLTSFKLQRTWHRTRKTRKEYIKQIFYKNNCHKLNITIDDILGECDLPCKDAVIVRKKVEEFIPATGKEI